MTSISNLANKERFMTDKLFYYSCHNKLPDTVDQGYTLLSELSKRRIERLRQKCRYFAVSLPEWKALILADFCETSPKIVLMLEQEDGSFKPHQNGYFPKKELVSITLKQIMQKFAFSSSLHLVRDWGDD